MSNVLVHVCCAPCFSGVAPRLREEGYDFTGYWYNPTIQPYREYQMRLHTLQRYAYLTGVEVIYETENEYPIVEVTRNLANLEAMGVNRCTYCYALRLRRTAEKAKALGYDYFTTTLLVSPHQQHENVRDIGRKIGKTLGIPFLYIDFRRDWKRSIKESRKYELYRQPYCGCIFSEYERFSENPKINPV